MKTIELSIQEIVNDFYSLAETEGYLSGRAECYELNENDYSEYYKFTKKMINKYIPSYENHLEEDFKELNIHDKAFKLSSMLQENFKEMFYKLV